MDDEKSLVFKGRILEGPINIGMVADIPITSAASISMKVYDIIHYEKQKDQDKKIGLVIDFADEPEALDIVLGLNIQEETLELR